MSLRNAGVGPALAVLMLLACSPAPSPVREQPKAEVEDTSGLLPASEAEAILRKFPKLARSYEGDSIPPRFFRLRGATACPLQEAFPGVRFYQGLGIGIPPHPYVMAVTGDEYYFVSYEFNRLLFATSLGLTDSNIIPMAKAFVVLAAANDAARDAAAPFDIPPITIVDAERTKEVVSRTSYDVSVKVRVGEQVQEWYLEDWFGQFRSIYMKNPNVEKESREPELCGSIIVLGYIMDAPMLVDPRPRRRL